MDDQSHFLIDSTRAIGRHPRHINTAIGATGQVLDRGALDQRQ
jgi:hypothetical protein